LTEIAAVTGLSRPTVKYHIDKLVGAGVIRRFTIDVDFTCADSLPVTCVRVMLDIQLKRNACSIVYNSIATAPYMAAKDMLRPAWGRNLPLIDQAMRLI